MNKPLIYRSVGFLILFIIATGILGPWIISTPLLYRFGFFIYPNIGKVIIISMIVMLILSHRRLQKIKLPPYGTRNGMFIGVAIALITHLFRMGDALQSLLSPYADPLLFFGTHVVAIAIPILLLLGSFGVKTVYVLFKALQKEIAIGIFVGIGAYFSIFQVWKLWQYFSHVVLYVVYWLFSLTFEVVRIIPPRGLFVQNFAVSIEQSCSGVDSLFLFSLLYAIIAIIDWKKIRKIPVILMYVPLAIGMFLVNILRVYILILVGVLISPQLALQLFHTYLGMIFFIAYFAAFLKWVYPRLSA